MDGPLLLKMFCMEMKYLHEKIKVWILIIIIIIIIIIIKYPFIPPIALSED